MFGLDNMFDMNRDGKLDSMEKALEFAFLEEMSRQGGDLNVTENDDLAWDDIDVYE